MAGLPSKLATSLLLAVGFGALLAWFVVPMVFRDKTPILSDFLDVLHQRSRELEPDARLPVPLPPLHAGEQVIVAMGPRLTTLARDVDLSSRARSAIDRDLSAEGPDLTFVYLVDKGELRGRLQVSRCNLTIAGTDALVVTSSSSRLAFIECGPLAVSTHPEQCRTDFVGLWNERCAARLVAE